MDPDSDSHTQVTPASSQPMAGVRRGVAQSSSNNCLVLDFIKIDSSPVVTEVNDPTVENDEHNVESTVGKGRSLQLPSKLAAFEEEQLLHSSWTKKEKNLNVVGKHVYENYVNITYVQMLAC